MEHVRTQMPYAMLAMAVASLADTADMRGLSPLSVSYLVGVVLLIGFVLLFGERQ